MSSTTCHLSSIEICENDDVVILPIKYEYLTETCQLVYGTNGSCTIAHLPLFGKYCDYGKVKLNSESEMNCDIFRVHVNKNLMNNASLKSKKERSSYYFGESLYIFKRESFDEADRCEWYSDTDLIKLSSDESRYLNIDEIESNSELLDYLSIGALTEINSRTVSRFGYVLIKRDIYDAMIKNEYSDDQDRVSGKIHELLNSEFNDELHDQVTEHHFSSNVLEIFNGDKYLSNRLFMAVYLLIKTQSQSPEFLVGLLNWSLINRMYRDLGKSYYPNVRRHGNMKPLHALSSIVKKHIEDRKDKNIKSWQCDNGNSEKIPERYLWDDQ